MFTISNGIILKGENLVPVRENIVVDDGKIIEISKDAKKARLSMSTVQWFALHLSMAICILGTPSLRMKVMDYL